jgi:hypothetical protein
MIGCLVEEAMIKYRISRHISEDPCWDSRDLLSSSCIQDPATKTEVSWPLMTIPITFWSALNPADRVKRNTEDLDFRVVRTQISNDFCSILLHRELGRMYMLFREAHATGDTWICVYAVVDIGCGEYSQ